MKQYALICKYKPLKGFFKKKVAGEYLIFAVKLKDTMAMFQFFDKYKDFYIVAFEGGIDSPDDEALEEGMDNLRYNANVEILEDKVGVKDKQTGRSWEFNFSPSSKYLGNKLSLLPDSRLPHGYFFADVKMKKGFEPSIQYKIGSDALDLADIKKMRAFMTSRLKQIISKK